MSVVLDEGKPRAAAVAQCLNMWRQATRGMEMDETVPAYDGLKSGVRIKAVDDQGRGMARIATLGVVDKDLDITKSGAFGEQKVKLLPAHDWKSVPLGKARVFEHGDEVLADFQLNLEIEAAKAWHSAIKFDMSDGNPIQEYSYGFTIIKADWGEYEGKSVRFLEKLKVHEVSPVVVGAGIGTGTLEVKRYRGREAVPLHEATTSADPWDSVIALRRLKGNQPESYYNRAYALRSLDGEPGAKSSWQFLHHFIKEDGEPGPASTRACYEGIAILNGAYGGTTVVQRQEIYDHLAKHIKDAGETPPELRSAEECGVKLLDQLNLAIWSAETVAARLKERATIRSAEGRDIGEDARLAVGNLDRQLSDLQTTIKSINEAVTKGSPEEARKLAARFHSINVKVSKAGLRLNI
jgi:HK97 family phage prohead protease